MLLTSGGRGRDARTHILLQEDSDLPRSTLPDGKGGNLYVGPPSPLKQTNNIKTTEAMTDGPQGAAIGEVHRPKCESKAQMRGDGEQEDRGCIHDVQQNLGGSQQIKLSRELSLARVFAWNQQGKDALFQAWAVESGPWEGRQQGAPTVDIKNRHYEAVNVSDVHYPVISKFCSESFAQ